MKIIHYSHNSSQPYVAIKCREDEGIVHYVCSGYRGMETNIDKVYRADDNASEEKPPKTFMYTFDEDKVTCERCKDKMKQRVN